MKKKATVIGAGNVGATAAMRLAEKELADVVLIDIIDGVPAGKALDLAEAAPIEKHDSKLEGVTGDYSVAKDSDVVIITAGIPRKPGMSRDDLLNTNMKIMESVSTEIAAVAPNAVLIVVSNPLDAMCHVAYEASGFPKNRVIGMAGVLDSARFRAFISMELNVSVENTHAFVLGGHGDTMVPLISHTMVSGRPVMEKIPPEEIENLVRRTRDGGAEIVSLLKTGSAYYAPAASTLAMAEAILNDSGAVMPVSAFLNGEYGLSGICIGVPASLGKGGIKNIIETEITPEEKNMLRRSAEIYKKSIDEII